MTTPVSMYRVAVLLMGAVALASCDQKPATTTAVAASAKPPTPAAPAPTTAESAADSRNVQLQASATEKNPISTAKVTTTKLSPDLDVVGSVGASEDHFAVVGPLVSGRVARILAGLGDLVRKGQILAELESSEVGEAQAAYLTARARLNASQANLRRENDLAAKRISPERDREMAVAQAESEKASLNAAEDRLRAMGMSRTDIEAIERGGMVAGRLPIRASIAGTVIERKVTLGQAVERGTDAFKIADLRVLWVLLDLYEKDLAKVHVGQRVQIRTEAYKGSLFEGKVAYIGQVIDEETRTAKVRIEFENKDGRLRLGQLVTARILGDAQSTTDEVVAVPRTAVQRIEGRTVAFVRSGGGFVRRIIEVGASGGELVEVKQGLAVGDEVATDGAFLLKSELLR